MKKDQLRALMKQYAGQAVRVMTVDGKVTLYYLPSASSSIEELREAERRLRKWIRNGAGVTAIGDTRASLIAAARIMGRDSHGNYGYGRGLGLGKVMDTGELARIMNTQIKADASGTSNDASILNATRVQIGRSTLVTRVGIASGVRSSRGTGAGSAPSSGAATNRSAALARRAARRAART